MGQYLQVGMLYNLKVGKKKERYMGEYTREDLLQELSKRINIDLFDIQEDEEYIELNIKEDILVENVQAFVQEQYGLMNKEIENKRLLEILDKKNYQALINDVEDKCYWELQLMDGWNRYLVGRLDTSIEYKAIGYFLEGKMYMECYYSLFEYMERLIKKSSSNILKDTVICGLN